ncbi:outer membrane protein [Bradyrhizobium sp.]|jgi:outer membrane immunogenic protein|uniref:outer membrane protein n=1 Tax=Bradyrhizobium sp. TaxID=376 RepID=UPI003C72F19F
MRRYLLAAMMFGAASGAQAADMPDLPVLRGSFPAGLSTATRNWDGWYAGGQVGYSSANMDFAQSVVGLTNTIFRNSVLQQPTSQLSLLNKASVQSTGFGAFVGRNYQYDDLVFSLEANYNYINNLVGKASASIGPLQITNPTGQVSPPGVTTTYAVTLTGTATAQIKDVITFRGRAGWAYENFLPYMFGGLAVGRMDVYRNVTSAVTRRDDVTSTDIFGVTSTTIGPTLPVPSVSQSLTQERTNNFVVGWTLGLGMEYMVWNCLFLRGEWEYIKFVQVMNTPIAMNSARLGIGYKF